MKLIKLKMNTHDPYNTHNPIQHTNCTQSPIYQRQFKHMNLYIHIHLIHTTHIHR